jgi:hypothetical protein
MIDNSFDFGFVKQVDVGGMFFNDIDGNGERNDEPSLIGVTIQLQNIDTQQLLATTLTDNDGFYLFNSLENNFIGGQRCVCVLLLLLLLLLFLKILIIFFVVDIRLLFKEINQC